MEIKNVKDPAFKKYGKVIDGYDFSELLSKLSEKPMPADSVVYVPSDADLESVAVAKQLCEGFYGGLPIQVGYCNGNNRKLNAVEYHRSSEVNVPLYDMVVLIGDQRDIEDDYTYDTSLIEAFLVPAGVGVEFYATTLHYAPCNGVEGGFRNIVVLPKGTNEDLTTVPSGSSEDKLLFAANKWLIGHKDGGLADNAFIGLKGENIEI